MKRKELILNPFFIIGLVLLILNDFYLKYEFGNFITGKLSDFAGLLIFPMFIAAVYPKSSKYLSLITGIVFFIWKLPLFSPVIDAINTLPFISIGRVVDYSDYMALLILPFSHYLINKHEYRDISQIIKLERVRHAFSFVLLTVAFFAFCATSAPYRMVPAGSILIDKSYDIKLPKDSVINSIKRLGYNCDFHEKDSLEYRSRAYYQTDDIVRYYHFDKIETVRDTIASVKYHLDSLKPDKTRLTIINVTLSRDGNIQDWKRLKRLSKEYDS